MMQIEVLKSKIHRVTITEANLNYVGSITIDEELMEAANLIEGERVQIWNVTNGERLDTSSPPTPAWNSRRRRRSARGWSFPTRRPTVW